MTSSSSSPLTPPPANGCALFLDFDGTLAPIQNDPDAVTLSADEEAALGALADRLGGAVAVLSGRDVRDLSARAPDAVWRVGGHGLEICAPGEAPRGAQHAPPAALAAAVEHLVAQTPGARIEPKGPIIAVHYRAAPEAGPALGVALEEIVADVAGYSVQAGKMVFEAKPSAAHKGDALARLMTQAPFKGRRPIMVGDDTTDEDGFETAQALGGFGVKVGAGETVAAYRLASIEDLWSWLETAGDT